MTELQTVRPGQVVGRNVRRLRQERGGSQRWLVKRMRQLRFSWHQTTVQGIERGTRLVSIDELFALAICLDTNAASLLDPVFADAPSVDVGLREPLMNLMFRDLIPVPWKQGEQPPKVNVAYWRDDEPGERAGKVIISEVSSLPSSGVSSPPSSGSLMQGIHETLGKLGRQIHELEERTRHEG